MYKIYIFGVWHQGLVAASVLAESNSEVICVVTTEENKRRFENLDLPLFEPGLQELLARGKDTKKIHFVLRDNLKIESGSIVILAHDIRINEEDESDLTEFDSDLNFVINSTVEIRQVLITAQIPVGTYNGILKQRPKSTIETSELISVMPENLRLGRAIERFQNPQLPVIGCSVRNRDFWQEFFRFTNTEIQFCTQTEAELLKHALNSYLAMSIAFGNEIYRLGDSFGLDSKRIIELLELEPRVGGFTPKRPGLPFFGGTLARDLVTLNQVSIERSINISIIESVLSSNREHMDFIFKKIMESEAFHSRECLSICVLGLTYTAETSTLRRSPGLWLVDRLRQEGFEVVAYDPRVNVMHSEIEIMNKLSQINSKKIDCFILVSSWGTLKDELSRFVNKEHFIDIEGNLSQDNISLPFNYYRIV
jgi:UDPglucose 6-dehydrogenase